MTRHRAGQIVVLIAWGIMLENAIAPYSAASAQDFLRPQSAPVFIEPALREVLQAAVDAVAREDWNAAVRLYREAIEIAPNEATLYNNLGVIERRRGNIDAAITAYRRTLELNSSFTEVYPNLAVALLATEQWQEALDTLDLADVSGVFDPLLPLYRALAHEKLRQWRQAAEAYEAYVQSEPNALGYYRAAIAHWQAGEGAAAARAFQLAARLDPAFPLYTSEAGLALAKLGVNQSAVKLLSRLPTGWTQPSDFVVLARLARQMDMDDLAETAIARALQSRNAVPASWASDAGVILTENGQLETASRYLNRVLESVDEDEARTVASYGNPRQVRKRRALAIASANLAELYMQQNQPALALTAGQTARSLDPLLPVAHNNLGVAAIALNRPNEAAVALQEAVILAPEYWQAHRNLGLAYAHLGNRAKARQHLLLAMDTAPTLERVKQLNRELIQLKRRELPLFQTDDERAANSTAATLAENADETTAESSADK